MPAVSKEALWKKEQNRLSKKDILREEKILSLGGIPLCPSVTYGKPLAKELRDQRVNYLYDLLWPNRRLSRRKNGEPRKRKYATPEEAKLARNAVLRERYQADKRSDTRWTCHSRAPWGKLCSAAKNRAKLQQVPFEITPLDVLEVYTDTCPILGIPLEFGEKTIQDNSPTLDKIVPEKGYVKGNIAVISAKANRLKSNGDLSEVRKVFRWLLNQEKSGG